MPGEEKIGLLCDGSPDNNEKKNYITPDDEDMTLASLTFCRLALTQVRTFSFLLERRKKIVKKKRKRLSVFFSKFV